MLLSGAVLQTDYLSENGRRVPMFGRKSINGGIEWMGVPEVFRDDGPPLI